MFPRMERGQVIGRKTLDSIARRDIAVACAPERHRIDERLAEDDLLVFGERRFVPHPAMRSRQIQVVRRARAQPFCDLAAVDFGDLAGGRDDRDHDRAIEVLVTGFAVQAEFLQATADVGAGLAVLLRQPQTQRPIGKAELEALDQGFIMDAALGKIAKRLRALFQPLVVIGDGFSEECGIVGIEADRCSERAHRAVLRGRQVDFSPAQQLHRVAEAHALGFHHPVDRPAADLAAIAVPQVLPRRHDQRGFPVVVEWAATVQVLAHRPQGHPRGLHQPLDRYPGL